MWYDVRPDRGPEEIVDGMDELGADRVLAATLEQRRYNATKYKASVRHLFHGTALDWQVALGKAARLVNGDIDFLTELPAALLHVNHVYTLGFALELRRKVFGSSLPIILETHDIQSQVLHDRGDRNPWTGRPDRLERLIKSEAGLLRKANVLVHLSVDDFEFFRALIPSKPHFLSLPTIDENFCSVFNTATVPAEGIDLLFVGQWNHYNFEAVKWFLEQVWPLIAHRQFNLKIVGCIETLVRRDLPRLYEAFRSCFVGEVPDLIPYYRAARCVIAPMISGTGISIKTMEALALGKAFVGTSKAFRGMPMDRLKAAGVKAHDGAEKFADAIVRTLDGQREAQERSRAAYDTVFSARASFAARDEALRAATASPEAMPLLHRLTRRAINLLEGSK